MDFERGCLDIYFRQIDPQLVLNGIYSLDTGGLAVTCRGAGFNAFYNCALSDFGRCSKDELQYAQDAASELMEEKGCGVFGLLARFTEKTLLMDGWEPKCRFSEAIRWREISYNLGQDIFTTAFAALQKVRYGLETQLFTWPAAIKTDNRNIEKILSRGMAENHYHLNGSTQVFPVSWASLMNHIVHREHEFKRMQYFLVPKYYYSDRQPAHIDYYELCKKAAAIRAHLFMKYCINKEVPDDRKFNLAGFISDRVYQLSNLQRLICRLGSMYGNRINGHVLDYALCKQLCPGNFNGMRLLAGERFLLYKCFCAVFNGSMDKSELDLFYAYLLIKSNFRGELIQINDRYGFRNFSDYQDRKSVFIVDGSEYDKESTRLSVSMPFECQNLKSLEARISPQKSAYENIKYYNDIRNAVVKNDEIGDFVSAGNGKHHRDTSLSQKKFDERVRLVLHFIKEKDQDCGEKSAVLLSMHCRHYALRNNVKRKAIRIAKALDISYRYRHEIVGIDACSNEIGCRPEVFAQAFRYLQDYCPPVLPWKLSGDMKLSATYHAGEDFLDLADGLRAIDEAVKFCGLGRSSRIGHAVALGTDPYDYYKLKHTSVTMKKQDWLDNIAWIYGKANELGINLNVRFNSWLISEFDRWYTYIYGATANKCNIDDYYRAWKLRGDAPELYLKGIYRKRNFSAIKFDNYAENSGDLAAIRKNNIAANLYFNYHYNGQVKKKGYENSIFDINDDYVLAVKKIQQKMGMEICDKGINIECNPSSNVVIGTFRRYDKHPIFKFYDKGINAFHEGYSSPELCVSVNTDDQGVFDTLLYNEYELLACALYDKKNADGEKLLKPADIDSWIDDVRKMGIIQSFFQADE